MNAGRFIDQTIHRYAIYDLEFKTSDGRTENKLSFILYTPDSVDSKVKFPYAATKKEVTSKLAPINREFQINDWEDLDEEELIRKFNK
jgi:hypothetical protein